MADPCTKYIKRDTEGYIDQESLDYAIGVLKNAKGSGKTDGEIRALAQELREEMRKEVSRAEYEKVVNEVVRERAIRYVLEVFKDDTVLGIQTLLASANVRRANTGLSLDALAGTLENRYNGRLLDRTEQAGVTDLFRNSDFDELLAQDMYNLSAGKADSATKDPDVFKLAKIVHDTKREVIDEFNLNGGTLTQRDDYIVQQSHDTLAIREAGFKTWSKNISPLLDWGKINKTLMDKKLRNALDVTKVPTTNVDKETFLRKVYSTVTTGYSGGNKKDAVLNTSSSITNMFNAERVLHFASPEAFVKYNRLYGQRGIMDSVLTQMRQMAYATAQLKVLGTNAENNFKLIVEGVMQQLKDADNFEELARLTDAYANGNGKLNRLLRTATGSANAPANITFARLGGAIRGGLNLVLLPGTTLASLPDMALTGARAARYNKNSMWQAPYNLLKGMSDSPERVSLARQLGVYSDSMINDITSQARVDADAATPRVIQRLNHWLFKYTLANRWNYANRRALVNVVADTFTNDVRTGKLNADRRGIYLRYGIEQRELDLFGKLAKVTGETLTPDDIREAPRDLLRQYAEADAVYKAAKTAPAKELRLDRIQDDLALRLNTFYLKELDRGVLKRSAKTRAVLQQGTNPGDPAGEAFRFFGQLKSYSVEFMYSYIGDAVYGRDANIGNTRGVGGFIRALQQQGAGELASSFLAVPMLLTFYGYISFAAAQVAAGREPPPLDDPKTLVQALLRGGGLTIFGQFLYDTVVDDPSVARNVFSTLLGPFASKTDEFVRALQKGIHSGDSGTALAKFGIGLVPGLNAPFIKIAADILFMHALREAIDPSWVQNIQKREQERNTPSFTAPIAFSY
jgi:hypothetical protein